MADDVASLGLKITQQGVKQSTSDLQAFRESAKGADDAAQALNATAGAAGPAMKAVGEAANGAGSNVISFAEAVAHSNSGLGLNRIQLMEAGHLMRSFATAAALGVSPMQAIGMETGRLATFFMMGDQGVGGTFQTLKAGAISLVGAINPVAAAMAAIGVAVGGTLLAEFVSANRAAKELDSSIKSLGQAQTSFNAANRAALTPLATLRDQYGQNAEKVRELNDALRSLALLQFEQGFSDTVSKLSARFGGMDSLVSQIDTIQKNVAASRNTSLPLLNGPSAIQGRVDQLQSQFGVSTAQAQQLVDAWHQIRSAVDEAGKTAALDHFNKVVMSIHDASGAVPAQIRQWAVETAQLAVKGYGILDAMTQTGQAARNIAGVDMSSGLAAAEKYSRQMGVDLITALNALNTMKATAMSFTSGTGRGTVADGIAEVAAWRNRSAGANGDTGTGYSSAADYLATHHAAMPTTHHATSVKKLTDAQKAYQQVIKDVSGNLSEYHLMLAQVDVAQRSGAISAAQAQVETAKLNERILESTDAGKFYAQSMQSFESSMAKAIVTGGSLSSVLSNLAAKFAEAAFQAALFGTGPMGSGTVASGGGLLGGLFTGALGLLGGGIDTSFISAHATGTSYAQGGMALVGENGPEAVSLPRGAKVFSAGVTRAQGNQQAAQPGLVHVIVSADSSANLAPIIQQIAGNVTATALTSYDQTVLPGSMARISNDPRARG